MLWKKLSVDPTFMYYDNKTMINYCKVFISDIGAVGSGSLFSEFFLKFLR